MAELEPPTKPLTSCSQGAGGAAVMQRLDLGKDQLLTSLTGLLTASSCPETIGWRLPSGLCRVDCSLGQLTAGEKGKRGSTSKAEVTNPCNLVSEVTSHHFCTYSVSLGIVYTQGEEIRRQHGHREAELLAEF